MAQRGAGAEGLNMFDLLGSEEEVGSSNAEDDWMVIARRAATKAKAEIAASRAGKQPAKQAQNRPSNDSGGKAFVEDYYRAFEHVYQDSRSGEVVLRFHKTNIVRINTRGDVLLTTCGWTTYTTLAAMNDALQAIDMRVTYQGQPAAGQWTVRDDAGRCYHYQDNMIIKATSAEHKNRGRTVLNAYHGGAEVPRYASRQQPGAGSAQQQQQQQQQQAAAAPARTATTTGPGHQQQQPAGSYASLLRSSAGSAAAGSAAAAWGAPYQQQQPPAASRPAAPRKPAHVQLAEAVEQLGMQDEIDCGDEHLCVVCLENPRDEVLVPCGHLVLCRGCCTGILASTNECPVCRETIADHCTIDPHEA